MRHYSKSFCIVSAPVTGDYEFRRLNGGFFRRAERSAGNDKAVFHLPLTFFIIFLCQNARRDSAAMHARYRMCTGTSNVPMR